MRGPPLSFLRVCAIMNVRSNPFLSISSVSPTRYKIFFDRKLLTHYMKAAT